MTADVVLGNVFDKYGSRNPFYRAAMRGYFSSLEGLLADVDAEEILEVGCGEGYLADWLFARIRPRTALALDLSHRMMRQAALAYPRMRFLCGSAVRLPLPRHCVDAVFCLEVLEHLESPEVALDEIHRVTRRWCLFTVPLEPLWRVLNLLRGAYWRTWGNTPGHLQHWSRSGFLRLLGQRFRIVEVRTSLPWAMALCSV